MIRKYIMTARVLGILLAAKGIDELLCYDCHLKTCPKHIRVGDRVISTGQSPARVRHIECAKVVNII